MTTSILEIIKQHPDSRIVQPHPGGQTTYFTKRVFELLFGGAAGPGKSWALVIDSLGLQYKHTPLGKYAIEEPSYRAVLFRRKTTQLADLIEESKNYFGEFSGRYIGSKRGDPGPSFNFPKYYNKGGTVYKTYTEGARIFLCHLNEESDKENHHGFEYQFVGFDELTQFLYSQYIYLFSRTRSTIPNLLPRIRSTTNPVGIGLSWVKKRFNPKFDHGVVKYFIADPTDDKNVRGIEVPKSMPDALSRCFVPGKLKENLTLQLNDPGYASRIRAMGIKMSKALLDSDWDILEGQFFTNWNQEIHVIKPELYWSYNEINLFEIIGVIDYGRTMVFSLMLKDNNDNIIMFDQFTSIAEVRQVRVKRVKKILKDRGLLKKVVVNHETKFVSKIKIYGDTDMWLKDAFDLAQQEAPNKMFDDAGIPLIKVRKQRTEEKTYRHACNNTMQDLLYYEVDETGLITRHPRFKVYERCKEFIDTFPGLPQDEDDPEDIADVEDDHWYDSTKMGVMVIRKTPDKPKPTGPKWVDNMKKEQLKIKKGFMTR